jgi:phosphohistidine phosphatase SixA
VSLLLVRHAWAGHAEQWDGDDDDLRPLDDRGREQAQALVELLAPYEVERIVSSPATRCVDTVVPLAAARGLDVETHDGLHFHRHDLDGPELVRSLARSPVVVCGHGGLETALGYDVPWKKGAVLVLDGDLSILERLRA